MHRNRLSREAVRASSLACVQCWVGWAPEQPDLVGGAMPIAGIWDAYGRGESSPHFRAQRCIHFSGF